MCEWMWNVKFSGTIPGRICNLLASSCHSLKHCLGDRLWPTSDLGGVLFEVLWRPLSHQGTWVGTIAPIFSCSRFLLGKWKGSLSTSCFLCLCFWVKSHEGTKREVGGCCSFPPILNHDKVAGAFNNQEEETTGEWQERAEWFQEALYLLEDLLKGPASFSSLSEHRCSQWAT